MLQYLGTNGSGTILNAKWYQNHVWLGLLKEHVELLNWFSGDARISSEVFSLTAPNSGP